MFGTDTVRSGKNAVLLRSYLYVCYIDATIDFYILIHIIYTEDFVM